MTSKANETAPIRGSAHDAQSVCLGDRALEACHSAALTNLTPTPTARIEFDMTKATAKQKPKLTVTMWMTLDGFIAGPAGEMDWIMGDDEMSDYEIGLIGQVDTLLLGRKTYQDFHNYWSENGPPKEGWEKIFAKNMNALHKIAVSKTLDNAEWIDSKIFSEIIPEEIKKLKKESEKGIVIYGSASIVQQLANFGLIDEYQLLVYPVLLGQGKKLFTDVNKASLLLVASKAFKSGVMVLTYQPERETVHPVRGSAHEALSVFLGQWRAEGISFGGTDQSGADPRSNGIPWVSTHATRWHTGDFFLIQDEQAQLAGKAFDTISVMGVDAATGSHFARTFENHGFYRHYDLSADHLTWLLKGQTERARTVFSADGNTQTINWEWLQDGKWLPLCDRVATQVRAPTAKLPRSIQIDS
jgi:dihydrofolate reductase